MHEGNSNKISSKEEAETLNFIVERSLERPMAGLSDLRKKVPDANIDEFRRLLGIMKALAPAIGTINLNYDSELFNAESPAKHFLANGGFVQLYEVQTERAERLSLSDRTAKVNFTTARWKKWTYWPTVVFALLSFTYSTYDLFKDTPSIEEDMRRIERSIQELESEISIDRISKEYHTSPLPSKPDTLRPATSTN